MITRPLPAHWFSLILVSALLASGCVFIPVTGASPVESQSYDLPDRIDSNRVIQAVELALTQTLATTPRIVEGSVLSPLPARPAPFTVKNRRVYLERLGVVTIPEVGCPGNLAIMHAWVADLSESEGLHRYTACIQLYAGAYRVNFIHSRLIPKSRDGLTGPTESGPKSHPGLLPRLGQAFLEHVKDAREATGSPTAESVPSDQPTDARESKYPYPSTRERVPSSPALSEKTAGSPLVRGLDQDVVTAAPLVCLAPRHETAAVRTQHGGGQVIQMLEQGSLMAVVEPVDDAYFHVKTTEGLAGWINRSDVRRLPCPIG